VLYDTMVPVLTILGQYEISGRILLLPIAGKGDINITLSKGSGFECRRTNTVPWTTERMVQ
jgi:hypothetical protein